MIRVGRFISLPDIEAQLAPNNYMYTHSMTYTFDNYTNTGLQATLAVTRNMFLQLGVTVGSDTVPWNVGKTIVNPFPTRSTRAHVPQGSGRACRRSPGACAIRPTAHTTTSILRRCDQQRHLGLQQPAMVRDDLLPQVQRPLVHSRSRSTILSQNKCRTEQSAPAARHRRRGEHRSPPGNRVLQRPERRPMQRSASATDARPRCILSSPT